jgi:hypothetical protein
VVKVPQAQLELLAQMVRQAPLERLASKARLAVLGQQARLEPLVFLEVKDQRAVLGQQAFLGLMAAQAQQVRLA